MKVSKILPTTAYVSRAHPQSEHSQGIQITILTWAQSDVLEAWKFWERKQFQHYFTIRAIITPQLNRQEQENWRFTSTTPSRRNRPTKKKFEQSHTSSRAPVMEYEAPKSYPSDAVHIPWIVLKLLRMPKIYKRGGQHILKHKRIPSFPVRDEDVHDRVHVHILLVT